MAEQNKKMEWWGYSFPILLTILFSSQILLLLRVCGKYGPIIYVTIPLIVSILAIFMFLFGVIYSIKRRPFIKNNRLIWLGALLLFPLSFFIRIDEQGNFLNSYPSSYYKKVSKINYRVPFDTTVSVGWGGDNVEENYHVTYPDQRWAYDFVIVKNNATYINDSSKLENYFIYGLPILSPAKGKVVSVFDSIPDLKIGEELTLAQQEFAFGNFIMMQTDTNEYLVLCHLKPNTTLVKVGDIVEQSQKIAEVGNSGNSTEPHLHIHLQSTEDLDFAEGVPLYFHNYLGDGKKVKIGMPHGGTKDTLFIGQNIQHIKI
jgi:Peptidase family M23